MKRRVFDASGRRAGAIGDCRALGMALLFVLSGPPSAAMATLQYFEIDPSQSIVHVTAEIHLTESGAVLEAVGQGTSGIAVPFFGDGTFTQLAGVMAADIDWGAGTMVMGGSSMYGRNSGLWEPGPFGNPGVAPAALGALLQLGDVLNSRAVAAIRDFRMDYRDAYTVTSLARAIAP